MIKLVEASYRVKANHEKLKYISYNLIFFIGKFYEICSYWW